MKMSSDQCKVPYSRSFAGRNISKSNAMPTVDTRSIQVYLRRQESRSSLQSSASSGFVVGDSMGSGSRPVSADAETIPNSTTLSSSSIHPNTRFVLPAPTATRIFASSQASPITRSSSVPSISTINRNSYLEKLVCRVNDFLFMGDVEAAYNSNLLCLLKIDYVIDISNVEPMKVPRQKRSDCPCLCPLAAAHSRVRMTITIEENSTIDLLSYFEEVNRFIESARARDKRVLVHSYHGRNRCAVLIVQYLMKKEKVTLARAIGAVRSLRPEIYIGENFMKSLRKWENAIWQSNTNTSDGRDDTSSNSGPKGDGQHFARSLGNPKLADGTPVLKRSAWL